MHNTIVVVGVRVADHQCGQGGCFCELEWINIFNLLLEKGLQEPSYKLNCETAFSKYHLPQKQQSNLHCWLALKEQEFLL
jgi:hypothetical protein